MHVLAGREGQRGRPKGEGRPDCEPCRFGGLHERSQVFILDGVDGRQEANQTGGRLRPCSGREDRCDALPCSTRKVG